VLPRLFRQFEALGLVPVGLPVGQQKQAVHPALVPVTEYLAQPEAHAAGHLRAAAGLQVLDLLLQPGLMGERFVPRQHTRRVVENGYRHAIVRRQAPQRQAHGLLEALDLVALHRAAAIQHEAHVHRHARPCNHFVRPRLDEHIQQLLRPGHRDVGLVQSCAQG